MTTEKIYVGKARLFNTKFEKWGIWIPDIDELNKNVNAQGGINLIMVEMQNPDRAGNTHTLYVDDYVPQEPARSSPPQRNQAPRRNVQRSNRRNDGGFGKDEDYANNPDSDDDDIPF